MTTRRARTLTYAIVAVLVAAALRFTPQLTPRAEAPEVLDGAAQGESAEAIVVQQGAPDPLAHQDTLARGETMYAVLARGGVSEVVAREALRAAKLLDPRRIPAGMPVTVQKAHPDSAPSEIVLQLAIDRLLHLRRTAEGWTEKEERLPWTTDTVVVAGVIQSSLYTAMDAAAQRVLPVSARRQLTWTLADILEYRVDMSRDLQRGDRFRVLAERSVSPSGAVRMGNVLAASFTLSGNTMEAVRFGGSQARGEYYDQQGRSLRAAFLRAPLQFRRISSVFGKRFHPVLATWKTHKGTDYAASSGTPVRTVGDGVVVRAGWGNGYGNVVEVRHRNGFVSRYAHLRGFASGIRKGARVNIAQTIGYVGSTGMSTGPHLHFEVLVNGVQRDPRAALADRSGFPISAKQKPAFEAHRARLIAALDRRGPTLASADTAGRAD
jgi:murein DD-endopeptidase MepM/ murein hydrolase activator NlpD